MNKQIHIVKNKRYQMLPPDGGWGYMICVAAIINYSVTAMFIGCFGMIYKEFMIEHKMDTKSVSLLSGLNMMIGAIAGYSTSSLLTVMSVRKAALIASILFNAGIFSTIFVNTTALFFICQIVQTMGVGVLYTTTCKVINDYFSKKQLLVMSLTQSCSAAGAMIAPYLVKFCLNSFSYLGTLVMISAISLQSFIAVALMQPVEWHLIRVELDDDVTEELTLLVKEKPAIEVTMTTPTITVTDADSFFDLEPIKKTKKGSKNIFSEVFDIPIWRKFLISNASMGPTYCVFAEMIFGLMLPQALYSWGFNQNQVTLTIMLSSMGDLITRVLFVFTSKWLTKLGNQEVYVTAVLLAFISRLLLLRTENTTAIMVFVTMIGVSRCSIAVMPPLIFAESFGSENFTKVLGIFMILIGIMNLTLGIAVGAIRDETKSYTTAFYVITSCYAVVVLLWVIELIYKRSKPRRIAQREAAEKMKKTISNK